MKKQMALFAITFAVNAQAQVNRLDEIPDVTYDTFKFTEGPVWIESSQRFIFSDIPNNTIWQLAEDGTLTQFNNNSGYANGNAVDKTGNIWSARHDRTLSRMTPTGKVDVVATNYQGKPLNSPNDITIASDGSVWFTDPPFGIKGSGPKQAEEEQPVRGIYRWEKGELTLMSGALALPNGLAFDSGHLFVANSADGWVYKFQMLARNLLGEPEKFAKSGKMADGIAFDEQHNLWLATTDGVAVFNRKGDQIDFLHVDAKHISNIAISPHYVLVTASNKILRYTRK